MLRVITALWRRSFGGSGAQSDSPEVANLKNRFRILSQEIGGVWHTPDISSLVEERARVVAELRAIGVSSVDGQTIE